MHLHELARIDLVTLVTKAKRHIQKEDAKQLDEIVEAHFGISREE